MSDDIFDMAYGESFDSFLDALLKYCAQRGMYEIPDSHVPPLKTLWKRINQGKDERDFVNLAVEELLLNE